MRVFGRGKIVPPINKAKNGDLLFKIKDERAIVQVRAVATYLPTVHAAMIGGQTIEISGELSSFRNENGNHYLVVLD